MKTIRIKILLSLSVLSGIFSQVSGSGQIPVIGNPEETTREPAVVERITPYPRLSASAVKRSLQLADSCRDGINRGIDYPQAVKIYRSLAALGVPAGINALAGMYRQGFGVAQSPDTAMMLYRQASEMGYGKSSYNLANLYRQGEGTAQDFGQAYELTQKAYSQGYRQNGAYMLGYYHLKGLGTEQSYPKALAWFKKGMEAGSESCYYFTGLFHIAGYGVEKNIETGMRYMEQAAKMGSDQAITFLAENRIENYLPKPTPKETKIDRLKEEQYITRKNTVTDSLTGVWEGKWVYYDWSGKRIAKERKLRLQLEFSGDSLRGSWLTDDSLTVGISGRLHDSVWVFEGMQYPDMEYERAYEIRKGSFLTDNISGGQILRGNIEQYSPTTKEPVAPSSVVLTRVVEKNKPSALLPGQQNRLSVSPNPFKDNLTVSFSISQDQKLYLHLYNLEGQTVYSSTEFYTQGLHDKSLYLVGIPRGAYCVQIKGETVNLTSLVIKQ